MSQNINDPHAEGYEAARRGDSIKSCPRFLSDKKDKFGRRTLCIASRNLWLSGYVAALEEPDMQPVGPLKFRKPL